MPNHTRGHDWARNMNFFCILLMLSTLVSTTFSLGILTDEDFVNEAVFNKRPQRFSFGLGKRSVNPDISYNDLEDMIAQLRRWGVSGPHGLFKRSVDPANPDLEYLYRNMGRWGLAGPHGLFKRGVEEVTGEEVRKRGAYSFGLGKRDAYSFGLGKRGQYSFGLGKRGHYSFGLGKRDPYGFGLGK